MSGKGSSRTSGSGSSSSGNSLGHPYFVSSGGISSPGNTYHYGNIDESSYYYHTNGNGSTYHNTGSGSTYTAPDGTSYKK